MLPDWGRSMSLQYKVPGLVVSAVFSFYGLSRWNTAGCITVQLITWCGYLAVMAIAAVAVVVILMIFSVIRIIGCALFSVALGCATFPHHLPYT